MVDLFGTVWTQLDPRALGARPGQTQLNSLIGPLIIPNHLYSILFPILQELIERQEPGTLKKAYL